MPEVLTPVAPLVLAGEQYLLAKNGSYSLHRPKPADAFGVVAHDPVNGTINGGDFSGLTESEVLALLQLLGTYIEENERLKRAVGKGAE